MLIRHIEQLREFEDEWNEVFRDGERNSHFLSFSFILLWYSCFAEPDQVRVYLATAEGKTIGFLPLVLKLQRGVRVLSSLTNDHCFHSAPLVRSGYEGVFPELIMAELLRSCETWDMLRYGFSYSFSRFPLFFKDDVLDISGRPWRRSTQPTYVVRLDKSFTEYFKKDLNSHNRNLLLRRKKLLTQSGTVSFSHYLKDEALIYWPTFLKIEDSGWKGEAGSSIARLDKRYYRYYEGLLKVLATHNDLHLYFLELEGIKIAGVFSYVDENIFHYAKTGYDEEHKDVSPSNLLLLYIIEDLMTNYQELKLLHMFPWDYGYKHKFSNEGSSCFETIIFNRTLRGQLACLYSTIKKYLNKSKKLSSLTSVAQNAIGEKKSE